MMEENENVDAGEQPQAPSPAEVEASQMGWEPQEKWHGKPEDWVDAETFVAKGKEINSVLKKQLQARDRELKVLKDEMAGMRGTVAELAEYRLKLEKTVYDRAMADLRAQLKEARREGDVDRMEQVEEAIEGMRDEAPKPKAPSPAPVVEPAEFLAWRDRNSWYNIDTNPKMVQYADGVAIHAIQSIQRNEKRQPTPKEVLVLVDEAVREMFPQAFSTPRTSMVESSNGAGSSTQSSSSSKGFSSLPKEAKDQFEKFYKAGYYVDMKTRKPLPKAEAQAEYFRDY